MSAHGKFAFASEEDRDLVYVISVAEGFWWGRTLVLEVPVHFLLYNVSLLASELRHYECKAEF